MLTDEDIKKLKAVFATKDDLRSFATKDDLKSFATKDDLKSFATKNDLKNELEKQLSETEIKLRGEIQNTEKRLRKEIQDTESRIYDGVGNIIHDGLLPKVESLDKRVTKIEQVPVIAHAIKK